MDVHSIEKKNNNEQAPVIVMMVPFPEQSHLNQLLRLSCLISSHNIPVHFVASATHNRQVKVRAGHGINPVDIERIHFHDLSVSFLSPSPNPDQSTTKFPTHLVPVFEAASSQLRQPFTELLHEISATAKRVVIIHDACIASVVQDAASMHNTETYAYWAVSAFFLFSSGRENSEDPFEVEAEIPELPSVEGCVPSEVVKIVAQEIQFLNFRAGDLVNTSRLMEPTYVDLLEKLRGEKKQWAIAPLHPITNNNSNSQDKCLNWLDKQEPNSVIYIAFGSTTSMKNEQTKELAIGLEQSKIKFIWVLRDADKGNIFTGDSRRIELPEGFEKRTEGLGMIVRDWAPQLQILGHPSTGGFMSHCGWTSCLESLTMGVPIAAWPMHSEQPNNAVLISDVLKVGLVVKKWTHREELVESSYVKEAVTRLMASEEGNEMRKRADSLGKSFKSSAGKDGVSCTEELESFVAHITR